MNYLATSVNESPIIACTAGAAITDVRGHAVKFDASGNVVLAGEGDTPLGIGIMTSGDEGAVAQGADVDIQHKDIGLVAAGGTIAAGANLSVGADGVFVTASSGAGVAIALEAGTSGQYIKAILRF